MQTAPTFEWQVWIFHYDDGGDDDYDDDNNNKHNLIYSLITIRLSTCFDPVGSSRDATGSKHVANLTVSNE